MRRHVAEVLFLAVLALTGVTAALALPSDREQPIQVSANQARFNEKTGIATYTGDVVIRQGTLLIRADEVVINTDREGSITSTVARGQPARYQQQTDPQKGPVTAEAARIDYDARTEIITLTGQARLQQDGSRFQGSTITYNSLQQQVDAKGEGADRVQLIFPPQARTPRKDKSK